MSLFFPAPFLSLFSLLPPFLPLSLFSPSAPFLSLYSPFCLLCSLSLYSLLLSPVLPLYITLSPSLCPLSLTNVTKMKKAPYLKIYDQYGNMFDVSLETLKELSKQQSFAQLLQVLSTFLLHRIFPSFLTSLPPFPPPPKTRKKKRTTLKNSHP